MMYSLNFNAEAKHASFFLSKLVKKPNGERSAKYLIFNQDSEKSFSVLVYDANWFVQQNEEFSKWGKPVLVEDWKIFGNLENFIPKPYVPNEETGEIEGV